MTKSPRSPLASASKQRGTRGRWEEASEVEREAAWAAFKALRHAGWSSEAREVTRDELHDRERPMIFPDKTVHSRDTK